VQTDWGAYLRRYRREKSLTQEQLSLLLDVEVSTLSRWERGLLRPSVVLQSRIIRMIPPRQNADDMLRRSIETSPIPAQLMLPSTRILATSESLAIALQQPLSELNATDDVLTWDDWLLDQHANMGGHEYLYRNTENMVSSWVSPDPKKPKVLSCMSQRVRLDDGTPAVVVSSHVVPDGLPLIPLSIVKA
jgi:DNA-binding XRE family transcriptional regulator